MFTPSTMECRLLSELAYSDSLNDFYLKFGPKKLSEYPKFIEEFFMQNKIETLTSLESHFKKLFSNWKLLFCLQPTLKILAKSNNLSSKNPLLDAFAFQNISTNECVIVFRGTNSKFFRKQSNADMAQNLNIYLSNRLPNSQLGIAEVFTKFIIQNLFHIDFDSLYKNTSGEICNLTQKVYLTGHSKGGNIAQSLVCILREEFNTSVQGITFSATPIYLLDQQLLNPSRDWLCDNYLLLSDRVLYSLNLMRFTKTCYDLNKEINNPQKEHSLTKLQVKNIKKFWELQLNQESFYVGGIKKIFTPRSGFLRHQLHHYDKYFNSNGEFNL